MWLWGKCPGFLGFLWPSSSSCKASRRVWARYFCSTMNLSPSRCRPERVACLQAIVGEGAVSSLAEFLCSAHDASLASVAFVSTLEISNWARQNDPTLQMWLMRASHLLTALVTLVNNEFVQSVRFCAHHGRTMTHSAKWNPETSG